MSNLTVHPANNEINTVKLKKNARVKIALIWPGPYYLGMSNLGFHSLYHLLNQHSDCLCERFFYDSGRKMLSLESCRPLKSFDVLAFSISYELDYINFFKILKENSLAVESGKRTAFPLIILGGAVTSFNQKPLSKFCDAIFVGEAEESARKFMDVFCAYGFFKSRREKDAFLNEVSRIEGIFVPQVMSGENVFVAPALVKDVDSYQTVSRVITADTEFSNAFLMEISRGCCWNCNFCVTGAVYPEFRPRKLEALIPGIDFGLRYTRKIGLVAAAITDHPQITDIILYLRKNKARILVSSLRVETVNSLLLENLAQSGQRTVTFAPEAGSEKLRYRLNKKISNQKIIDKIVLSKDCGMKKIKLYFMIGLPDEEDRDVLEIITLAKQASRIIPVRINIGIFVPKPKTFFSDEKFADKRSLAAKVKILKKALSDTGNIELAVTGFKEAYMESLFAKAGQNFFDTFGDKP